MESPSGDFAQSYRAYRGLAASDNRVLSPTRRRLLDLADRWLNGEPDRQRMNRPDAVG